MQGNSLFSHLLATQHRNLQQQQQQRQQQGLPAQQAHQQQQQPAPLNTVTQPPSYGRTYNNNLFATLAQHHQQQQQNPAQQQASQAQSQAGHHIKPQGSMDAAQPKGSQPGEAGSHLSLLPYQLNNNYSLSPLAAAMQLDSSALQRAAIMQHTSPAQPSSLSHPQPPSCQPKPASDGIPSSAAFQSSAGLQSSTGLQSSAWTATQPPTQGYPHTQHASKSGGSSFQSAVPTASVGGNPSQLHPGWPGGGSSAAGGQSTWPGGFQGHRTAHGSAAAVNTLQNSLQQNSLQQNSLQQPTLQQPTLQQNSLQQHPLQQNALQQQPSLHQTSSGLDRLALMRRFQQQQQQQGSGASPGVGGQAGGTPPNLHIHILENLRRSLPAGPTSFGTIQHAEGSGALAQASSGLPSGPQPSLAATPSLPDGVRPANGGFGVPHQPHTFRMGPQSGTLQGMPSSTGSTLSGAALQHPRASASWSAVGGLAAAGNPLPTSAHSRLQQPAPHSVPLQPHSLQPRTSAHFMGPHLLQQAPGSTRASSDAGDDADADEYEDDSEADEDEGDDSDHPLVPGVAPDGAAFLQGQPRPFMQQSQQHQQQLARQLPPGAGPSRLHHLPGPVPKVAAQPPRSTSGAALLHSVPAPTAGGPVKPEMQPAPDSGFEAGMVIWSQLAHFPWWPSQVG